jgi:hypothetical protein
MIDKSKKVWVNDMTGSPTIKGNLEISKSREGIYIGGDPDGLLSLSILLNWLANVDQESLTEQPNGARMHIHLHAKDVDIFNTLTPFSEETALYRLDAKGTGEFPEKYHTLKKKKDKAKKRKE